MNAANPPVESHSNDSSIVPNKYHLRLWPAVLCVVALGLARLWATVGDPAPTKFFLGLIIAPAAVTIALLLWWMFGSRLRWTDRLSVAGVFLATAAATIVIAGKNFPAMGLILFALPVVTSLWVGWLILSQRLSWPIRRAGVICAFLACGLCFSLLRVDGFDGSFKATMNWRWTPTSEDKLLSQLKSAPEITPTSGSHAVEQLTLQDGDWPCFRGPQRDSRVNNVRISTDWETSLPKEVWRHRVGPGWSSFSVIGDHLFTQEQRGDDEYVVCYDVKNGKEIWTHHDAARFEEVVAGPGPRGTPTFHDGRIYALGAKGQLNCLNAASGELYWTVDIVKDSKANLPPWGFSSSPLVSHGLVSVFAGGANGKSVLAYQIESGKLAWAAGDGLEIDKGLHSYCSTQEATIDGVEQLLISTNIGLTAFQPEQGTVLWEHRWPVDQARVVQPTILNGTDILLGTGMNGGTRRLSVSRDSEEWQIKELWTTKVFKPYYNDLVVMDDYLYGFDGNIFMCVGLKDGRLRWRERGYGNGQVLLLVENAMLLILSEQGEVALVKAQPEAHVQVANFKAIEGKTWNHPVVAHGNLFVRNAEEMACFTLPLETETTPVQVDTVEATTQEQSESK